MDDVGRGQWLRVLVREQQFGLRVCLLRALEWKRRRFRGALERRNPRIGLCLEVAGDETQEQERVRRLVMQP
jgi:hypothetical protein